jgi:hypothetical protein
MGRLMLIPFLKRCLSATAVHGMKRWLGIAETKAYQRAAVWACDDYSVTPPTPTVRSWSTRFLIPSASCAYLEVGMVPGQYRNDSATLKECHHGPRFEVCRRLLDGCQVVALPRVNYIFGWSSLMGLRCGSQSSRSRAAKNSRMHHHQVPKVSVIHTTRPQLHQVYLPRPLMAYARLSFPSSVSVSLIMLAWNDRGRCTKPVPLVWNV